MPRQRRIYVLLNRTQFMFCTVSRFTHVRCRAFRREWHTILLTRKTTSLWLWSPICFPSSIHRRDFLRCVGCGWRESRNWKFKYRWIPSRVLIKLNRFSARRDANDWSNVNAHIRQIARLARMCQQIIARTMENCGHSIIIARNASDWINR